jgi:elongation factor Ts
MLTNAISRIGENIKVRRFVRFALGEGLAKKETDFAAEVAAAAGLSS